MCHIITYFIILQRHEVVVDVLVASIFLHPRLELLVVQYLPAVFQYKGVSERAIKNKQV